VLCHTLDFADEALFEMLRILHGARIGHAGAGEDLAESSRAAITYVQGRRIGVIAFTDNEPGWEAEVSKPGIFYVPIDVHDRRAKKLLEMIHTCKAVVDFLIVSAPWGPNWGYRPPGAHPTFARALLEAGADAIFEHSGHVFRGIELYQGKPIIYCAGNFIDDYAVDEVERNDQSWMFVLEIDGSQVQRLLLCPTVIRGFQARRATPGEAEAMAANMQRLCTELITEAVW
jgi:poly-gamma-glutamate capsule biosynthesis protein CapA/YwtB (metallophosphatase superfamily)